MLLLESTDKLQLVTASAGAIHVHGSYADNASGTVTPDKINTPSITTAVTTDIVAAPAGGSQRNVQTLIVHNAHASVSNLVTLRHNDGTNTLDLIQVTLLAGETLWLSEGSPPVHLDADGLPKLSPSYPTKVSTADQSIGASTTAYLTGSALTFPSSKPLAVGDVLEWRVILSKTAAATASMTFDLRQGSAGTTGDTSRANMATGTQSAAADVGRLVVTAVVRAVGASGILHVGFTLEHNLAATGLGPTANVVSQTTTSSFDTSTNNVAGLSLTTSTSHAITIHQVVATRIPAV